MTAERAEYTIAECCRALRVSPSGFYAWQQRPASPQVKRDRQLRTLIRASYEASRRTSGSPRVLADLRAQGVRTSRKRIARLMQAEGLRARVRKRFRSTTVSDHVNRSPATSSRASSPPSDPISGGSATPTGVTSDDVTASGRSDRLRCRVHRERSCCGGRHVHRGRRECPGSTATRVPGLARSGRRR
jgi:transposase InsO family protein